MTVLVTYGTFKFNSLVRLRDELHYAKAFLLISSLYSRITLVLTILLAFLALFIRNLKMGLKWAASTKKFLVDGGKIFCERHGQSTEKLRHAHVAIVIAGNNTLKLAH